MVTKYRKFLTQIQLTPFTVLLCALWILIQSGTATLATGPKTEQSSPSERSLAELKPDRYVRGVWTIEYLIQDPNNAIVPSQIHSFGFEQIVQPIHRGYRITVKCDYDPVRISVPFSFDPEGFPEPFRESKLIAELKEARRMHDAVRLVFGWIERVAIYENDGHDDQDWETVLKRGTGNCVGRSVLAVEILKALGISARTVTGCLLKDNDGQFHRWLEIDYPGLGTLPSELGITMDFIEPDHLVIMPGTVVEKPVSRLSEMDVHIQVIKSDKQYWIIDQHQSSRTSPHGMVCRKTDSKRHTAAVIGTVFPPINGRCHAELEIGMIRYRTSVSKAGNFYFLRVGT